MYMYIYILQKILNSKSIYYLLTKHLNCKYNSSNPTKSVNNEIHWASDLFNFKYINVLYTCVRKRRREKLCSKEKNITVTMYDLTILKVYFRLCVFLYPKWPRIVAQSSGNSLCTSNVINVYIKLESSGSDQRNLNKIG